VSSMPESPSSIAARLLRLASERIGQTRVADVRIGLLYTAVVLEDEGCGLALTSFDGREACCQSFAQRVPLTGRLGIELLAGFSSRAPIEVTLALACANAVLNRPGVGGLEGDVLDVIGPRPEDRVVMVGHFQPVQRRLQGRVASLEIFERKADRGPGIRPAEEVFAALPEADVALVTATALLNHSLDPILAAASSCRRVALLGASTPLAPEAFANTPVDLLSGVLVSQPAEVLTTVSEGGGMAVFKRYVDKINLEVRRN